jgi:hypothetical protein
MKTLYSFDFDDTLCMTPNPLEGRQIWLDKFKFEFPAKTKEQEIENRKKRLTGWWGREESLDLDVFEIPKNEWVYKKYLEATSKDESYIILATGRLEKAFNMRVRVETILQKHNLSFDEIHLNWGMDTFKFKCSLFEQLIRKIKPTEFIMYDDRESHLPKFENWAKEQPIPITIVDVVNKNSKTFNK